MKILAQATDYAWFAGFFEGEGSVRLASLHHNPNGRTYATPTLDICQVNKEPLERCQELFDFGKIYGPYQYKSNKQPHYKFVISGKENVSHVFDLIGSQLTTKRRVQFAETLEAYSRLIDRPRLKTGPKPKEAA